MKIDWKVKKEVYNSVVEFVKKNPYPTKKWSIFESKSEYEKRVDTRKKWLYFAWKIKFVNMIALPFWKDLI